MKANYKNLKTVFPDKAKAIHDLISGRVSPDNYGSVARWIKQCYHRPSEHELIIEALNEVLETHGVEAIRDPRQWDRYYGDTIASYCNTGDTYAVTILFDHSNSNYYIVTWGDWLEHYERKHGRIE